jgi:hypothetical protein
LTSLNLAGNAIGGYLNGSYTFIATPEGIAALSPLYIPHAPFLISLLTSGPAAIADAIKDMGALTVLNLADNSIKAKHSHQHALSHAIGLRGHSCDECRQSCIEAYRCGRCDYDCCAACNNSECPVVALANAIKDMGALTSLNISSNYIGAYWDGQWIATPEGIFACMA